MPTVLITGGTGMIGKAITKALLAKSYEVIVLTRKIRDTSDAMRDNSKSKFSYALWDIRNQRIDENAISKADYIIHLAGAGIADKRWTKKRKKEIISSRVDSSTLLVHSLKKLPNHVKAVVSASAIGWYGPDAADQKVGGRKFTESDLPANDFLGNTCRKWEESIEPVTELGKRLIKLRTAPVLSRQGGMLAKFISPLRFGLATILGSGQQIVSWIHIDDLVKMYIMAIENESMAGVYNAVSPNPVSNKELVLQLARIENGKFFIRFRVPSFLLKLLFGELSIEVLKSTSVSPANIEQAGFVFRYSTIREALVASER